MNTGFQFDRENFKRSLPFAIAAILGVVSAALPPTPHPGYILWAAVLIVAGAAFAFLCDAGKPGGSLAIVPSLSFLCVLFFLLEANDSSWGILGLVFLPVIWVSLNLTRRDLFVLIFGIACLLAAAIVADHPTTDHYGIAALWILVSGLVGFTVQGLVAHDREQGSEITQQHAFLGAIFDQTGCLIAVLDLAGRLTQVNPACEELTGYDAEALVGTQFWDRLIAPRDKEAVAAFWALPLEARPGVSELAMVSHDGEERLVHWTLAPIRGEGGTIVNFVATGLDVTAEREARDALAESEYRFRTLVEHLPEMVMTLWDREMRCTMLDGPMAAVQGRTPENMLGRKLEDIVPPENFAVILPNMEAALRGESRVFEYRSETTGILFEMEIAPHERDGEIVGTFMVSRDITKRRETEAELRAAEERFAESFEHAPVGMEMFDLEGRLINVNAAFADMLGFEREALIGMHTSAFTAPADAARDESLRNQILGGEADRYEVEKKMIHADGHKVQVAVHVSAVKDAEGKPRYFVGQILDITAAKEFERDLRYMADHDAMTGLLNRRCFEEELQQHLLRGSRYGASGAILMLDLDKFKDINDNLGHAAGDAAIVGLARLLAMQLRATDTISRLGGDEFAVLLPEADRAEAAAVAGKLVDAVAGYDFGAAFADRSIRTSIGVVDFEEGEHRTPADAMIDVDAAMYAAKGGGGSRFSFPTAAEDVASAPDPIADLEPLDAPPSPEPA